jgi:hypothetical protein
LEDPGIAERIILKRLFKRLDEGAQTVSIWFRIGTDGGLF